jgi:hypothetical protein
MGLEEVVAAGLESACLACRSGILEQLAAMRASPCLRPCHARFGLAALCTRSLLDDFSERLQLGAAGAGGCAGSLGRPDAEVGLRSTPDSALDARYVLLCCPALEHSRQALQVRRSRAVARRLAGSSGAAFSPDDRHKRRGVPGGRQRPQCRYSGSRRLVWCWIAMARSVRRLGPPHLGNEVQLEQRMLPGSRD